MPRGSLNCSFRRKDKVGVPLSPLVLGLGDGAMAFEQIHGVGCFASSFFNHQTTNLLNHRKRCSNVFNDTLYTVYVEVMASYTTMSQRLLLVFPLKDIRLERGLKK